MATRSAKEACDEFCWFVDHVHGTYLDATMAMGQHAAWLMKTDLARLESLGEGRSDVGWEELNPEVAYTGTIRGRDGNLNTTRLHDLIARNSVQGANWTFLALMCVVAIYQVWDDQYRAEIAVCLGVDKSAIKADIFGELRHLRRSIIHRRGLAVDEVANAKLTRAFPPGARLVLEPQDIHDIVDLVKEGARSCLIPPAA
jgi:hypothetical protein